MEIEQKDKKRDSLEYKIGLADSKVIEEMNKMGVYKVSSKKYDSIMDRLYVSLRDHKNNQNKKQ